MLVHVPKCWNVREGSGHVFLCSVLKLVLFWNWSSKMGAQTSTYTPKKDSPLSPFSVK